MTLHNQYASGQKRRARTALDLFAGAGGLTLGLMRAGFEVVAAADSWHPAVETYRRNFDHAVLEVDLATIDGIRLRERLGIGSLHLDVVAGGPPCQGFSIQRIGRDVDDRNQLVLRFGDLVRQLRPTAFVMENVPGLLGRRGRHLLAAFEEQMRDGGYEVETKMLNAADFGVPQVRRRVFVIGVTRASGLSPQFPAPEWEPQSYRTAWEAIGDLPSPPADRTSARDPLHWRTRLSDLNLQRIRLVPPGGGFEDLPPELRVAAHREGAARIGHRNVYGRLAADKPSATITARFDSFTRGKFGHPYEDRNITLREGARLQTFDDDFRFRGTQEEMAALIGNAVPPLLARAVGCSLMRMLDAPPRLSSPEQLRLEMGRVESKDAGAERVGRVAPPHLPSSA